MGEGLNVCAEESGNRTPLHHRRMGLHRRRVFVEDSRRNGVFPRTTWHPEGRQFVVSTWDGDVCTGAVRVPVAEAPELISLLVDGLAHAAAQPTPEAPPLPAARRHAPIETLRRLARRGVALWRGRRASV